MKNQFKIYANYGVLGRENPCFYALDRDAKGHRVNLNIIEE